MRRNASILGAWVCFWCVPLLGPAPLAAQEPAAPAKREWAATEAEAQERLKTRLDFDFDDAPLSDLKEFLEERLRVQILFDKEQLDAQRIDLANPIWVRARRIEAKRAFDLALRPLKLVSYVEEGMLFVTTPEDPRYLENVLVLRVYNCRDLLRLEPAVWKPADVAPPLDPKAEKELPEVVRLRPGEDHASRALVEVIEATARRPPLGGPGDSPPFPGSVRVFQGLVTVRTRVEVHERIEELLQQLREAVEDELQRGAKP